MVDPHAKDTQISKPGVHKLMVPSDAIYNERLNDYVL